MKYRRAGRVEDSAARCDQKQSGTRMEGRKDGINRNLDLLPGYSPVSSSRSASISARACWLPVRLAVAMPSCRRAIAASGCALAAMVWADIW